MPSGQTAYIFERRHHQIYRDGRNTITDAMGEDVASWMIEHTILRMIQKKKIQWIIIFVVNTGEYYTASREKWEDKTITRDMDTRSDRVRHLGLQHMKLGRVTVPI